MELKKSYVATRIKGFSTDGMDWNVLSHTLCAMGLAVDNTKGNSNGCKATEQHGRCKAAGQQGRSTAAEQGSKVFR